MSDHYQPRMENQKDQGEVVSNKSKNGVRCFTLEISKRKKIDINLENNKVVSIESTSKSQIDLDYLNSQLQSLGKGAFMDGHLKRTLEILIGQQGNRLLGGGCGTSKNKKSKVPEKKTNLRNGIVTKTNPVTTNNTLMRNKANNSKGQDQKAIQQKPNNKPAGNSTSNQQKPEQKHQNRNSELTGLQKKFQEKSNQKEKWSENQNSNFKIDPAFEDEFKKLTNPTIVKANLNVKSSSYAKQQSQQGNQLEGNQPEEVNLQAEIIKIEDCLYKYRQGFSAQIKKYSPYYIELFELILTYQLIGVYQQNSSSAQFLQQQKDKLNELKELCLSQQETQPALDIIFYLDFFIKVKGSSFLRAEDFKKVPTAVKKCSAFVYTLGTKVAGIVQGNFKDGFEELLKLSEVVISLIQEVKAKNLFQVILRIQTEKMNFLNSLQEKQQQKQISNVDLINPSTALLEEEILFYIEKFNKLVENDKEEEPQKNLVIFLMLRINYLLQKVQEKYKISDSGKTISKRENLQGGQSEEDNSKTKREKISFNDINVIQFVKNLIIECEDSGITDYLKKLLSISVSNYYLRFASLSLQIRLRKIFSKQQNSEKSELLKLLELDALRWFVNENEKRIMVLLYYDEDFKKSVLPGDDKTNEKLGLLDRFISNQDLQEDYLNYDKDWRNKIGQYLGGKNISTVQDLSQIMQKIEDNCQNAKEISDKKLENNQKRQIS